VTVIYNIRNKLFQIVKAKRKKKKNQTLKKKKLFQIVKAKRKKKKNQTLIQRKA